MVAASVIPGELYAINRLLKPVSDDGIVYTNGASKSTGGAHYH
jgi:hypothetical protein